MYQYPYGNAQQLNLDWILSKIQELEAGSGGGADLEEVANALISATYAVQNYNRSDIVFYDGKLYRANQNITAEAWDATHWDEILLGDTVANLVRYVGSLNNSQVVNSSNVAGTHTSDALNNLADDISDLNGALTAINPFVNTKLKKWDVHTNGKIIFVGNSYAKDPNTLWAKWPDVVADELGLGTENGNWWNVGYPGYAMTTGQFLTQLQTWLTNNPTEAGNIGAVICVAGLNDSIASAYNNIGTAIQNLVSWINANLPRAKTYFGYSGFVNQAVNLHSHPSTDEYRFYAMLQYMKCTDYGAIYLSGVENIIHNKNLLDTDGIHPNANGAKALGLGVVNALLNGYAPCCDTLAGIVPTTSTGTIYGSANQSSINGIVTTSLNIGVNYTSPYPTWNVGDTFDIGTLVLPFTNGFESTDIPVSLYADGVGTVICICRVAVDKITNTLKCRIGAFSNGLGTHNIVNLAAFAKSTADPLFKELYTTV